MSNVTIPEIVDLVAKAYRVERSAFLRQPVGMTISPAMREARAVVFMLVARHTLWTGRQTIEAMGLAYNGDLLRRVAEEGERFAALMDKDPGRQAMLEGVERGIDRIHESREALPRPAQTGPRRYRPAQPRVLPLRPVQEQDLTDEWWASNDLRFRAALLEAAE